MSSSGRFHSVKYLPRLAEFLNNEIEKGLKEVEDLQSLSASHFEILTFLLRKQKTNMSLIARAIHRKKPTVTVLVGKLEELGLVKRYSSEEDKRETNIELTRKGKSLKRTASKIGSRVLSLKLWGLNPQESEQLFDLLEKIYTHLRNSRNI
ncbi:MarR family transcriptional regulator [Leptospira fluminis]|uniref:MarR family transcriptional regulator n=1 Tax=Leptospira fluminis TaxID=2484979 RepID=A0A4R9GM63_9LEPT|nr:MarR family transcriptional regulator [Leptospira fluminis]TGK17139.1 MarR family transcriptional regulator [Leptospira fluminis]